MSDLLNDSQQVRSGLDLFARFLLGVHRLMLMLATPRRHRFQTPLLSARYGEMMTEFFGTAAIPLEPLGCLEQTNQFRRVFDLFEAVNHLQALVDACGRQLGVRHQGVILRVDVTPFDASR